MRAQKQQNVTQERKGGIQQKVEYVISAKAIQNSGRWALDSNKRNTNQVATEDEKSAKHKSRHLGKEPPDIKQKIEAW